MNEASGYEWPNRLIAGVAEVLDVDAEIRGRDVADVDEKVLLHGPPGAGKTMEATKRTALRMECDDLVPNDVAVITYRRSQSGKVRDRLESIGVIDAAGDLVDPFEFWTTIHAYAGRASGFNSRVLSSDTKPDYGDAGEMLNSKHMEAFCGENDVRFSYDSTAVTEWSTFHELYTYAKNNLLDLDSYRYVDEQDIRSVREDIGAIRLLREFRDEWPDPIDFRDVAWEWEQWKAENDVYDFWEMLEAGLVADPEVEHVVVDELHDCTPLMSRVAERLVDQADSAVVCGDPNQVVNQFSGSHPSIFRGFTDRVGSDVETVALGRSWRCADEHFEAAARMLEEGGGSPPRLRTTGEGFLKEYVPDAKIKSDGDDWVLPRPGARASPTWFWQEYGPELMVLARCQWQLNAVAAALDREGIVYQSQAGVGGNWERRLTLLRALRKASNHRPYRTFSIEKAARDDVGSGVDEFEPATKGSFKPIEAKLLFEHSDRRSIDDAKRLDDRISDALSGDGGGVGIDTWDDCVKRSWWGRYGHGQESIQELTTAGRFSGQDFEAMRAAWHRYQDEDSWSVESLSNGTRLLTIHASKGDEETDVVVYDGISQRTQRAVNDHDEVRLNEGRTWYVALTRASERLHVVRGHENVIEWLPEDLVSKAKHRARKRRQHRGEEGSSTTGVVQSD